MRYRQPRLTDISFLGFDTETTGLFSILHRLVEVGALRFRLDGSELAIFQQLIDPHIPSPPNVQQVHGITDQMMRGKPTIEQVLPRFIEFLGAPNPILLAHNASSDSGLLAMALTQLGIRRFGNLQTTCWESNLIVGRQFHRWSIHSSQRGN